MGGNASIAPVGAMALQYDLYHHHIIEKAANINLWLAKSMLLLKENQAIL